MDEETKSKVIVSAILIVVVVGVYLAVRYFNWF